jgi:hypothetical protein
MADFKDFGIVFLFDVIEHLEKKDALKALDRIIRSGTHVLGFAPIEVEPMKDGKDGYDHLSTWTEEEFIDLGFGTELLPNFHGGGKDAVWFSL